MFTAFKGPHKGHSATFTSEMCSIRKRLDAMEAPAVESHDNNEIEVEEKISPRKESQSTNSGYCRNMSWSLKSGLIKKVRRLSR